ncbi:MAG: site-specific integrase [Armatimonadetes bacterium]|nr:site-specific integrase [Armatimonadota bacterium]
MAKRQRRADGYTVGQWANGGWWSRVTTGYNEQGNPKRKAFYGNTRAEVVERAQAFKQKIDKGGFAPEGRDTTVAAWLGHWLESFIRPHREPKTTGYYEGFIRLHIGPALGRIPLRKLTAAKVRELMSAKAAEGLSPSTVRGLRATLRAALNQAWKDGLIDQNVAQKVAPPKIEAKDEPMHLTPEQVGRFLDNIRNHPLSPLFAFTLSTGVRIGEATGLRLSDIDFEKRTARIAVQLQRIDGKLQHKSLKSKSARRTLHLADTAIAAVKAAKAAQLIDGPANPLGLVFLNTEGRPLDQKYIDKRLKALLVAAGLPPLSFHKLRHTVASLMVAGGVDLHQVKEQLGHSQISLTANLYAHGVSEAERRAANVLDEIIKRGTLYES